MYWQNSPLLRKLTSLWAVLTVISLPISTAMLSVCSWALFVFLLLQMQKRDWGIALQYPINRWLLALFALITIGLFYSPTPLRPALDNFHRHLFIILPLLLLPFCQKQKQLPIQSCIALILISAVSAAAGIIHYLLFPHVPFQDPAFVFISHIYESLFEAFAALIAFHLADKEPRFKKHQKLLYAFIILTLMHLIIFSGSRTGDLVLFGIIALLLWNISNGMIRVFGILALMLGIVLGLLYVPVLHQNFLQIYQNYLAYLNNNITTSAAIRLSEWKMAGQIWLQKPIFGYGTSGYWTGMLYVHHLYPEQIYFTNFQKVIYYPENQFLFTLAEQGLVGFILLLGFLVSAWRMSYHVAHFKLLVQGLILAFILFSLSQATLYIHSSQSFFMLFFSILLCTYNKKAETSENAIRTMV